VKVDAVVLALVADRLQPPVTVPEAKVDSLGVLVERRRQCVGMWVGSQSRIASSVGRVRRSSRTSRPSGTA
jgi:hypothetical protein